MIHLPDHPLNVLMSEPKHDETEKLPHKLSWIIKSFPAEAVKS